eukprot:Seg868.5 transcript_id=Seg868.5/GoldUCD/mRNA.D3Y31 product="hypothetical protein" protein_id=Seg868.5/GoldUCD/D3Y31
MVFFCVYCNEEVGENEEVLDCDTCKAWQHRACKSGIGKRQYREIARKGLEIEWECYKCKNGSLWLFRNEEPMLEYFHINTQIEEPVPIIEESLEDNPLPINIQLVEQIEAHEEYETWANRVVDTQWQCSVCGKKLTCGATIQQTGNVFKREANPHSHPGRTGIEKTSRIVAEMKEEASQDIFKSAATIVEGLYTTNADSIVPFIVNISKVEPSQALRQGL